MVYILYCAHNESKLHVYIGLSPLDIGYVHCTHFNENFYRDYIGLSQGFNENKWALGMKIIQTLENDIE